jgi:hypothetical protein
VSEGATPRDCPRVNLVHPVFSDLTWPFALHQHSEGASLEWPNPILRPDDHACTGSITLRYSLARDGDQQVREVLFQLPEGFYEALHERQGFPLRIDEARRMHRPQDDAVP